MIPEWQRRTVRLLGDEAVERLAAAHVTVVGVGGVGGYAAEILVRSGIGRVTVIDADCVAESNINRQLIATARDVGRPKVELFAERFRAINPVIEVNAIREFVTPGNVAGLIPAGTDFVIDAIDTVAPKVALLIHCLREGIDVVSSMGAGGRTDPTQVRCLDISETRDDGLARAVRQRLRKSGVRVPLTVVASTEPPHAASVMQLDERNKRSSYGTTAAVPATFGICLGNYVVMRIAAGKETENLKS